MRLVRVTFALLLAASVFAMVCGPAALMLLNKAMMLPPALLLARALPPACIALAAVPIGTLGAAGLASAPWPLRLGASLLLALAVLVHGHPPLAAWPAPPAPVAPLLAAVAIVMLILTPRLAKLDPALLDAAAASGASGWNRLVLVVLPWIAGSCLAAFLLCFAAEAAGWLPSAGPQG